jgi:hypothetical protein
MKPVALAAHVAALALAGWALLQLLGLGGSEHIVVWLIGAVIVHDALIWPAYTGADRAARRGRPAGWSNYVRVPLGISALLALIYFPVMLGKGEAAYTRVSGREWDGYVLRWLLACAALFAVSGVVYLFRSRAGSSS